MIFILMCGMAVLGYKLWESNKKQKIAYNHYMNDRVVVNAVPPTFMVGPNGQKHPTWCPNCGKNL